MKVMEKNEEMVRRSDEANQKVEELRDASNKILNEISNVSAISEQNEASIEEVLTQIGSAKDLVDNIKQSFDELNKQMKVIEESTK